MSRHLWWRAYDEAVDDPKLILLTDKQHRAWFNLCCITSQSGGKLPAIAVVAVKLRTSPDKARGIVAELVALGLIDGDGNGVFAPHNWSGRQFQSDVSTDRVKRFRQQRRNVSSAVSETPPETENRNRYRGSEAYASAADAAPVDEDTRAKLFRIGKTILVSFGVGEKRTGSLIGQWLKERNDPAGLLGAIEYARDQNVAEPVAYISTLLSRAKTNGHRGKQDLSAMCFAIADELRQQERARGDGRSDELFRSG
jgi:hypothetical protein